MTTLAEAAALVPPRSREAPDENDERMKTPRFMELGDLIDALIVPNEKDREHVEWTWRALGQHYSNTDKTIQQSITKGVLDEMAYEQAVEDTMAEDAEASSNFLKRLAIKGITTVWRFLTKQVWKGIFSICKWIVKQVVKFAVRGLVNWLVRPILTGILEFIGVNPELWPIVAVLGGAAAVGYAIYDHWFAGTKKPQPDEDEDADDEKAIEKAMGLVQGSPQTQVGSPLQSQQLTAMVRPQQEEAPAWETRTTGAEAPRPAGAPVAAGPPAQNLMTLISRGEGSYNSVNRGAAHGYRAGTEDLEHMTVAEVMAHQQRQDFNAAGRYQIIKPTLAAAVRALNLDTSLKFDRATQDMIFNRFLIGIKRHQIADYISGRSDNLYAAVLAASQEWASVAAPAGAPLSDPARTGDGQVSYYAGTANNRASISANEMAAMLMKERSIRLGSTTVNTSEAPTKTVSIPSVTKAQQDKINSAQQTSAALPPQSGDGDKTVLNLGKGRLLAVSG